MVSYIDVAKVSLCNCTKTPYQSDHIYCKLFTKSRKIRRPVSEKYCVLLRCNAIVNMQDFDEWTIAWY